MNNGVRIVYNEPAVFVRENGSITAKLMFKPLRVLSAVNPATGAEIKENEDFTVKGEIAELKNSDVPYFFEEWLKNIGVPPYILSEGAEYGITDVLLAKPEQLAEYQFRFTYETCDPAKEPRYAYRGNGLEKVRKKLSEGKPTRILLYGDSISNAANSSGEMGISPFAPPWYSEAARAAAEYYKTEVNVVNRSKSGYGSEWGAQNADELISKEQFDLLVVAFGMNDGSEKLAVNDFARNVRTILNSRKDREGDFILVSTFLPNPQSALSGMQEKYRPALFEIAGADGAVMDMTAVSEYLLKKKRYCDVSGNNFNHPNDFVYSFYSRALSELLGVKQEDR